MTYSAHAVGIAKKLIQNGADIVTDTNMALAGVNKKELAKYGGEAHCLWLRKRWQRLQKSAVSQGQL